MQDSKSFEQHTEPPFHKKVWITVGIVAFVVVLLMILKATFNVFLLVLAGSLIAIFFRGISDFIEKKTSWNEGLCVAISIIGTIVIVSGLFWLIGFKIQSQIAELIETLPKTIENAKSTLNESSIGSMLVEEASSKKSLEKAKVFAGKFFQSTFGGVGDIYVVLFIGIFFTISPKTYVQGLVQLIPKRGREKGNQVLDRLSEQLLKWLGGKLISMFVVFVLTSVGLAIIGVPLWLVLGVLAGLLSFIPNFGPLLGYIPAVLIALMQSPQTALFVTGLYILIQFIESNFITTYIQKQLINMPPALILIAQLIMGVLTGAWGLVLATPLTVIVIVLVQELYLSERAK
ncbi:MAG: AI-2E family transporter [Chlorobiota bacterium]